MVRHILFDLDGTLTDPKPGITRSIAYALEHYGQTVDPEELTWCIGPPLRGSLGRLLETECVDTIEEALGHYRRRFSDVGLFENRVYDGIVELLSHLEGEGRQLHLATSKPQVFAVKILEHFGLSQYFSSITGSELDGTRDAKAEVIRHSLAEAGIKSAIMVGDRKHDVIGAAENALPCIGVLYGYGNREELVDAAVLCESPHALGSCIQLIEKEMLA